MYASKNSPGKSIVRHRPQRINSPRGRNHQMYKLTRALSPDLAIVIVPLIRHIIMFDDVSGLYSEIINLIKTISGRRYNIVILPFAKFELRIPSVGTNKD